MQSYIPANGSTLHLVGVCVNRIGKGGLSITLVESVCNLSRKSSILCIGILLSVMGPLCRLETIEDRVKSHQAYDRGSDGNLSA